MLSRLRTSPVLRRLVLGLALLLPLSLNAAAETCGMAGTADAPMHTDHAGMDHAAHAGTAGHGDCTDPACQTACAGTAAIAAVEPVVPAPVHQSVYAAPATAPRAGHTPPLLRPPLGT
ncbi:hypothetical protein PC39_13812 [Salinisphaera sp. PC39]|uniref:hypothetical protein n=1 Tax=Salinisphaera sp. PC39 TaxID=1304156 RepID=UPI00334150BC